MKNRGSQLYKIGFRLKIWPLLSEIQPFLCNKSTMFANITISWKKWSYFQFETNVWKLKRCSITFCNCIYYAQCALVTTNTVSFNCYHYFLLQYLLFNYYSIVIKLNHDSFQIHAKYEHAGKHKRNLLITGGVTASVLVSPILAGLAVGKFVVSSYRKRFLTLPYVASFAPDMKLTLLTRSSKYSAFPVSFAFTETRKIHKMSMSWWDLWIRP